MKKGGKIFYGWWIVVASFLSMTFLFTPIVNLLSLFTDPVSVDLGVTRSEFTLYYTVVTVAAMIMSPIAGRLMNKMDIRVYLTIFTALGAISYFGFSFSTNIYVFYIFSVIQGISLIAGAIIPASVLITNWFNDKRGLALGIALAGSGFGGIILSPVVESLLSSLGWRTTYLVLGVIILVTILPFTIFVIRFRPEDIGLTPLGEKLTTENIKKDPSGLTQKEALKTSSFWILSLAIVITGIVVNTMLINLTPYLTDIGATTKRAAFLLSFGSFMVLVGKLVVGRVFDKIPLIPTIIILSVANVLSFVALLGAQALIPGILYATFTGFGATALTIAPSYVTPKIFGEKDFSGIFGVVSIFSSLGTAISPVFSGIMYGINHSYVTILYTLMVLAIVSLLLYVLAIKLKPSFEE